MSLRRALKVAGKELRMGPRSTVFMWAVLLPVFMTFIIQVVFASLFNPVPRLGIVDAGSSRLVADALKLEGVEVTVLDDAERLKAQVEANDLDAGLVLPAGFDQAVKAGERPLLEFYIGGESLASNRVILGVTALDLVREVEGRPAPVEVEVNDFGKDVLPISRRLVPFILMYALIMSAVFLPAFSLVEEREMHTLEALIVTPVKLSEVVTGKAILGFSIAVVMSFVTLAINSALDASFVALAAVIVVAAIMCTALGLIYATGSKDATALFAFIKGTGIINFAPEIFYVFPNWPQWIAKIFPTYWFINPIYEIAIKGSTLADVWWQLVIALGASVALLGLGVLMTKRLQRQIAGG